MFIAKTGGTDLDASRPADVRARVRAACTTAATNATRGADSAMHTAGDAMHTAAVGVGHGVYAARGWAAPQLENAARYTTDTAAPAVSSALRSTARQVSPEKKACSGSRKAVLLGWSAGAAIAIAAAGAAAAIIWTRYRAAMAADSEAEDTANRTKPAEDTAEPQGGTPAGSAGQDTPGADTPVNKRVPAN